MTPAGAPPRTFPKGTTVKVKGVEYVISKVVGPGVYNLRQVGAPMESILPEQEDDGSWINVSARETMKASLQTQAAKAAGASA